MAGEWWENPTSEEQKAYWESEQSASDLSEAIVNGIENLELSGLSDPLAPRSEGALGAAGHLRRVFSKAFERVYANRRR